MEDVGIFYGHLIHFTVFCYIYFMDILFMVIWYIFPRFGQSGNPDLNTTYIHKSVFADGFSKISHPSRELNT
jgi:hypothetical protein